jgi:UDP-galactopyranose mutase
VRVLTPHLRPRRDDDAVVRAQAALVDRLVLKFGVNSPTLWYYPPDALAFSAHLSRSGLVYDRMGECESGYEDEILAQADLVFTPGPSLDGVRVGKHSRLFLLPDGADAAHFARARDPQLPADPQQKAIVKPRIGFMGAVDRRVDTALLAKCAAARPDWSFVMVGPLSGMDAGDLPQAGNIHYLGPRPYDDLPAVVAGWDVGLLPLTGEGTWPSVISRVCEYLSAGRRVVATPTTNLLNPYAQEGLLFLAETPAAFVRAIEQALSQKTDAEWLRKADQSVRSVPWDTTWRQAREVLWKALAARRAASRVPAAGGKSLGRSRVLSG